MYFTITHPMHSHPCNPELLSGTVLRRRCDAAGQDWSAIDVTFTNFAGGNPAGDDFKADAYLTGLTRS